MNFIFLSRCRGQLECFMQWCQHTRQLLHLRSMIKIIFSYLKKRVSSMLVFETVLHLGRFPFDWKNRWKFPAKWNSTIFPPEKMERGQLYHLTKFTFFPWRAWVLTAYNNKHASINCPEKFESVQWVFRTNRTLLFHIWISKSLWHEKDHF